MAIEPNIKRRFGRALACAAFAGLTCFGAVAMAQTPVTTAPAGVMLNQVKADIARIRTLVDLGVLSGGDVHLEPIDIHWGRIIDGAPLVHYGEGPYGPGGTPAGSSIVVDILNKKGELVEQMWLGIFQDVEQQFACTTSFCVWPRFAGDVERAELTVGAVTGIGHAEFGILFVELYLMIGVIDPERQAKWVLLGDNPECPFPERDVIGETFLGDGCEVGPPDSDPVFVSVFAPAMSGISEVAGTQHTVLLDASSIEFGAIAILVADIVDNLVDGEDLITALANLSGAITQ